MPTWHPQTAPPNSPSLKSLKKRLDGMTDRIPLELRTDIHGMNFQGEALRTKDAGS